jgi:hypothetical protein
MKLRLISAAEGVTGWRSFFVSFLELLEERAADSMNVDELGSNIK